MSGFEVVGIVLGTIPLVISALEHCHDGVSAIQRWRRYQGERRRLVRNLKTQQAKLQNICEEMLKGLAPASQIETMIAEPFGSQWRDHNIETRLRVRLGESFAVFQTTISLVKDRMGDLSRRLGIISYGQNVEESSYLGKELQRVVFALTPSIYSGLICSIRDAISDLNTLINQNISLEPHRRQRSQVQLLTLLRDLSTGLYRALYDSLPCACSHLLNLKLATRPSEILYAETESQRLQQLDLHIILCSCDKLPHSFAQPNDARVWRGLRCHAIPVVESSQSSGPKLSLSSTANATVGKQKRVSFQQVLAYRPAGSSTTTQVQTTSASTISTAGTTAPDIAVGSTTAIRSLCAETANATAGCYGYIADSSTSPDRKYMVYPAITIHNLASSRSFVSLQEVWEDRDNMPYMTYMDRLQLAVTVSSSFLQLYGTPWLSGQISSRDIVFLRHSDAYLYENVFIWKSTQEEPLSLGPSAPLLTARRNPTLLSLGFLLVEIFVERQLGCGGSAGKPQLERKFREAQALLPRLRLESSNYFSAVSRCLDGELHTSGYNETQLREKTYEGVVALLKKDLESIM